MANIFIEAVKEKIIPAQRELKEAYERDTGHKVSNDYINYVFGGKQDRVLAGGEIFEFYLYKQFYKLKIYKKFICNPILKTGNGTTEIDVIMITNKGIFVFECKHYSGSIYGDVTYREWLYYLGNKKYKFYNPIMQNKGHIKALMNELKLESKYFSSIIIFPENTILKVKGLETERTMITSINGIYKTFVQSVNSLPDLLTNEQVDLISEQLLKYCNYEKNVKEDHITSVKENVNKCPYCGKELVLRKSKTGSQFYGCSGYPKCRFTKNI